MSAFSKKIVWCDAAMDSGDNKKTLEQLKESYRVSPFADRMKAEEFLDNRKHEDFIVITSGRNGKDVIATVAPKENVVMIIVYCANRIKHADLLNKDSKVKHVVDNFPHLKQALDGQLPQDNEIAGSSHTVTSGISHNFHFCEKDLPQDFKSIVDLSKSQVTITLEQVVEELSHLNNSEDYKKKIKDLISEEMTPTMQNKTFLDKIIKLYLTDDIYHWVNHEFQQKFFYKVMCTTATALKEVQKYHNSKCFKDSFPSDLYFGLQDDFITFYKDLSKNESNNKGFWCGFSVLTTDKKVAEDNARFAVLHVKLNQRNPHPYYKLSVDGVRCASNEGRFLLFPCFAFRCKNEVQENSRVPYYELDQNTEY